MTEDVRRLADATALTPELPLTLRHLAPRVVVVGDLMLDGWWLGRTDRMAREAPAPVVEIDSRSYVPGGAANTAVNLAALGARVAVVGVVGDDAAGRRLLALLAGAGVAVDGVQSDPGVTTITKDRIVCGDQILLRIDEVRRSELSAAVRARLAGEVSAALPDADAVLVCDYGSGLLRDPVLAALEDGPRPPLLVVDAHDPAAWAALRPDLATPNAAEAFRLLGTPAPLGPARAPVLVGAAATLRVRTGATTVLVTLDREGTLLLTAGGSTARTLASPVTEKQASGAGDTFVAALTLGRAGGLSLPLAAELGQAAADVVVRRFGTSVCATDELVEQLGQGAEPVLDPATLGRRLAADRAAGRRVVLTNGCFDVLHRGHTTYLHQAARLGDVLVVAVNSDDSVRRLKGPERPINSAADRAGVISALSCVDYVTVFETDTPIPLLEQLRPDVYAKGGDYSPDMLAEAEVVRRYGGEVAILDYVPAQSTTAVVRRIRGIDARLSPSGEPQNG